MEKGQMTVEVQPTYKVEKKIYIIGDTPTDTDDELAYSGKLTIYLRDEVAENATNKPDA